MLASQIRIVVVAKPVGDFLIERPRQLQIAVLSRQTRAPVKRRWNLVRRGIERNLFFESFFRLFLPALTQGQPGSFPVRIRRAPSIREALLQLAIGVNRAIVIPLQEENVAGRQQRLLQPRTRRRLLPKLGQVLEKSVFIIGGPRDFSQQVDSLRIHFSGGVFQRLQNQLGIFSSSTLQQQAR